MNVLDMYYSQAERQYRETKVRDAIAGHHQRRTLKALRRRRLDSALAA